MRLIDADALLDHAWKEKLDTRELIAEMIENAPTVVPVYEKTGEKVKIQCDGKIEIPFEVLSDFGLSIVALQKCVGEPVDEPVDVCHFLCRHNENMRCKIGRNGAKCLKETIGR